MTSDRMDDDLDALFAAARDDAPGPDLMARVMADAASVQAAQAQVVPRRGGGWFDGVLGAIGGWPGVSGVTAAGVLGLGLGLYAPDVVDTLSGGQIWSLSGGAAVTPDLVGLWTEAGDV